MTILGNGAGEEIVLLDEGGRAIGTAPKLATHHQATPLHLAFSCYLVDEGGRVLLTQRSRAKKTWPGVWTNSCCGHPMPGEEITAAVRRRLRYELGLRVSVIEPVLPAFRYRAQMVDGTAENEICPVFRAWCAPSAGPGKPNPAEVAQTRWISWNELTTSVRQGDLQVSPWCVEQLNQLSRLGNKPAEWPSAKLSELPPAAQYAEPGVTR